MNQFEPLETITSKYIIDASDAYMQCLAELLTIKSLNVSSMFAYSYISQASVIYPAC